MSGEPEALREPCDEDRRNVEVRRLRASRRSLAKRTSEQATALAAKERQLRAALDRVLLLESRTKVQHLTDARTPAGSSRRAVQLRLSVVGVRPVLEPWEQLHVEGALGEERVAGALAHGSTSSITLTFASEIDGGFPAAVTTTSSAQPNPSFHSAQPPRRGSSESPRAASRPSWAAIMRDHA